jgi:hypothetical protein
MATLPTITYFLVENLVGGLVGHIGTTIVNVLGVAELNKIWEEIHY